jgi:quercetin dioxygenase-like cupin family protein
MTVGYGHKAETAISATLTSRHEWITAAHASDEPSTKGFHIMFHQRSKYATSSIAIAGAISFFTVVASGTAQAGSCPTDKMTPGGQGQGQSNSPAKGVTDTVIGSTDLSKEPIGVHDRLFRLRKLVVEPGGVVPWHSHGDRPAIIYIISGEITEYASTCAVPILHTAGETTTEVHSTAHWWKNTGSTTVTLLSADLLRVKDNPNMM